MEASGEVESEWVVIGIGSNYGDRIESVSEAIMWLRCRLGQAVSSDIYETPAYGHAGSPYMNAVVAGRCRSVEELQIACKEYELSHGRDAAARRNNFVPIDIDIVKAGAQVLRPADFNKDFFRIGYLQVETMS